MKYVCDVCGWVYDEEVGCEEKGIPAGTKFEDLPDDFECLLCGVGKDCRLVGQLVGTRCK